MLRVVFVLVVVGVTVYALVDCWRSGEHEVRLLPRPLWLLVILVVPLLGGVLYLVAGRNPETPEHPAPRPVAPDDDPEFLRRLDAERRRRAADEERRRRGGRREPGHGTSGDGPDVDGGSDGEDRSSGHPA